MQNRVLREITPLMPGDCFLVFCRDKQRFDFPMHSHEEMELNLVLNAAGATRIIGDHQEVIGNADLVLLGPNVSHGWTGGSYAGITEVTIQFHADLLSDGLLKRNQAVHIRKLFELSKRGIAFSEETARQIAPRLLALCEKSKFDSILELLSIIHDLSVARNFRMLTSTAFSRQQPSKVSGQIEKVFAYMNGNFSRKLCAEEVARAAELNQSYFSRFIKRSTGYNYIDCLNEIRLGHVSRMLIETTHSVAEIAYACGFNNLANFNRLFRKKKQCTPKQFRNGYSSCGTFV